MKKVYFVLLSSNLKKKKMVALEMRISIFNFISIQISFVKDKNEINLYKYVLFYFYIMHLLDENIQVFFYFSAICWMLNKISLVFDMRQCIF